MTQQSVKWLITVPDGGPSFNECLTIACGGNEKMASLLYFFLGRGAFVAGQKKQNPDDIEYIRLNLSLDDIGDGLKDLQRSASKPSIVAWMGKLNKLGYVVSNGYRQQYDIYFHKIAQGITTPPPREVALRGRHATKKRKQDLSVEEKQDQDLRFNPEHSYSPDLNLSVDSKDLSVDYTNLTLEIQDLRLKIQDLTLENLNLKSEMLDLKSEILKVKSLISHESASEVPPEGADDAINNISINNSNLKDSNASALDEPTSAPSKSKSSSRRTSKKKAPETATQSELPSWAEKPEIALSERGQAVFDEWCKQPWYRNVSPKLTETAIEHCNALAKYNPLPTVEEMIKSRRWYKKKYPERQGWYLGNFAEAYPQWLSEDYKQPEQPESEQSTTSSPENVIAGWKPVKPKVIPKKTANTNLYDLTNSIATIGA